MAQRTLFALALVSLAASSLGQNATKNESGDLIASILCYFLPGAGGGAGGGAGNNFPPLPPAGGNPGINNLNNQPGMNQPNFPNQPGMNQPNFPNQPGMNQPNFPNQPGGQFGQPNFPGQQFGQQNMFRQPGTQLGFANTQRQIPVQRNSLVQRQFNSPSQWYNDWYARFQPVYMRLTQNSEKTSRNLVAANYANNVRINYVNNSGSYLSQPGNAPDLFMKNLENRLNTLGTSNFPAEWKQETCGTAQYYHLCGRMTR